MEMIEVHMHQDARLVPTTAVGPVHPASSPHCIHALLLAHSTSRRHFNLASNIEARRRLNTS